MHTPPAPSLWSRLPLLGRLLIIFWVCILIGGAALLLLPRSTPPHLPAPKPALPKNVAPQPAPPVEKPTPPPTAPKPTPVEPQPDLKAIEASGKTPLAIVIQGFGYSDALTYDVLSRLPAPIAVGISPYIGNISDITERARIDHRETFLFLPMQSAHPDHVDEGPHALGNGNSPDEDRQQMDWLLSRAQNVTGFTDASDTGDDQPGGGFATTPDFQPFAALMAQKGLLYLAGSDQDNRHTHGMTATAWINGDTDAKTFDAALATHLSGTTKTPTLLMIGPLTPTAIDRLALWLKSPSASHFTLVPPSALADDGSSPGTP